MADRRFPTSFKDVPDADDPGLVLGDDNVVYLVKPDGSRIAVGSGGGVLMERAFYNGDAVLAIPNNSFAQLPWSQLSGSALLDLTDPSNPAVVTAGVYAVAVSANAGLTTAGGFFQLQLYMDFNGDDVEIDVDSRTFTAGLGRPAAAAAMTYYVPAGGVIVAAVVNHDGVASADIGLVEAVVSKLS